MKRILPLLALGLLLGACFFFQGKTFTRLWEHLLVVDEPLEKADALIVLGGEPLARPLEAARLFHAGVAPEVFVTGIGDAARNRQVLIGAGVPPGAIIMERKAGTTFANATLLRPLMESAHVRSALIVTSPFHTCRALATFRKIMPDITFGVVEASIGWWKVPQGQGDVNRFALVEFLKTAEYWILHGVSPILGRKAENRN